MQLVKVNLKKLKQAKYNPRKKLKPSKGQVVIHNHPSGGAFSKADLLHVASTNEHGIVAVGNKGNYILTKTKTFQSKEFIKAVNKAQWPIKYDYDKGADWWLKKNAKKFGYNYSFVS